ncbi:MAG: HAD family hydrolase [Clostridia bacterium]|nr:HAD family hydrolase [Clostridia bacterium]
MKVLFFDIGYTLVNEDAVWAARCREQADAEEAKRLRLTADDICREIGLASAAGLPQYRTVLDKYGIKTAAPYRLELETLYEDAPGVLETLAKRYALGVIANQARGLAERLESFGILPYFKYVISSSDVHASKPDPRIFKYALKAARCRPEEACMIGDRIDNDVAPAKAVGMKTVWVRQGFGRLQTALAAADPPDHTVDSLTQLTDLF